MKLIKISKNSMKKKNSYKKKFKIYKKTMKN